MQNTHLFVAAVRARVDGERVCWVREDPANPGLRSETWGTRIWGGGGVEADGNGFAISMVAVRA
jgi:hypothetical protein